MGSCSARTLVLAFCLLTACGTIDAAVECPAAEVQALRDLYDATSGSKWRNSANWLQGDPCTNAWHGVACNREGHVEVLALSMNQLEGALPESLGNLADLKTLMLGLNRLRGDLPASLCGLGLTQLMVGYNYLRADLGCFANMSTLSVLDLEWNDEVLGSLNQLQHLPRLSELNLRSGRVLGNVTAFLSSVPRARVLRLGENRLTGHLPEALPTSLEVLA